MLRLSSRQTLARLCALYACTLGASGLPIGERLVQFGRQNWQTENGLPQNTIHAIAQSSDGFLWLGTDGGLARFDGVKFTVCDTHNSPNLKSNNVLELAEDAAGSLWLSTPEGVTRWSGPHPYTFTGNDGLPPGRPWSLTRDSSGVISVASPRGLSRFVGGRFQAAAAGPDDPTGSPASRITGKIRMFLTGRSGAWFGTDRGVWKLDAAKSLQHYTMKEGLPSNLVTSLMQDRDGALWVGTESGIARIGAGKVETFPPNDALSTDTINALFEDREGDVWIGGDATGLTILRKQKFVTYSFRDADAAPQIRCVFGTGDGSTWIGTDGSGLKHFQNGQFSTLTTTNGLSSNVILSLGARMDGSLLVGTPDGLNLVRGSTVLTSYEGSHSLAEDFIRSLFTDRDGSLWVGTRRGLSHVSGDGATTYTQSDGLGSDTVGALLRDQNEILWIGTLHGLSRLDKNGIRNYTTAQGMPGNVVTDLYQDALGSLWIATQDGGLGRYRNGTFSNIPASLGLPQTIYGITQDRSRDFWVSAKSGIFRITAADLYQSVPKKGGQPSVVAYGTGDGLRVSEGSGSGHPAIWAARNGDIWFATVRGAALLASAADSLNRVVPPVAIENVLIDDVAYAPSQTGDISPGHARISFEYAALSFLAPQRVQYKYRLEGFDKNWIDAGTRRVAYYTNLPPRTYHFRVIARNNDGFWNERGAAVDFRILPRFYQNWWFYLLMLFAAAASVYGFYVWRLRQVNSRFEAVLAERNRIAREIHDTLAQGFVGVSVQLEVVSRLLSASTEAAREHLDQARILVRSSLAEARQSIWELRSQASDVSDFRARISSLAQKVTESGSVKVQFEVHGQYRPLKTIVEDELFRIGQEAIANAVRHSGARQIRVNLTFDSRKLRMTVTDDGCGFTGPVNSEGPEGHFGLKGMRERAERIDAQLNIESSVGSGTTVSVEAPAR